MITAELILPPGFLEDVEINFPGVPAAEQFIALPEPLVSEKARAALLGGKQTHGTVLFQVTSVEWRVDRLYAPVQMVVRLAHRGGV
jgi:hypothetical protein